MKKLIFTGIILFLIGFFVLEQAWERGLVMPLGAFSYSHVGLDVSHHQGDIDWPMVRGNDLPIDFVYIKATEGKDHKDTQFKQNWVGAMESGIRVGAYHFFTLCKTGQEQFENFKDSVPVDLRAMPPAIDLEFGGNCSHRPTRKELLSSLDEFASRAQKHYGKNPVLYVTKSFYRHYLRGEDLPYSYWVRDLLWRPRIPTHKAWNYWQFTSRARVQGINTPVDLNAAKTIL